MMCKGRVEAVGGEAMRNGSGFGLELRIEPNKRKGVL
jgi:hypothetical protein